ncbi:hypothetical protein [Thermomonas sp.]|uniref:hypothetical protein n=1 Tax=Thermomonas sp. TaxID=1971895 RepID=UPI0035B45EE1
MRMWKWLAVVALSMAWTLAFAKDKDEIKPAGTSNPPPSELLSGFDRYEVKPAVLTGVYAGQEINETALASFQRNFDERVGAWVAEQNARPARHDPARTLVIEPRIDKIRFISGGARVWAGAFAGSSRVLVALRLVDQATGEVIAEPEFYQHAKAMAGAWTFGVADNNMLIRTATMSLDYLKANQDQAVGAPTGWEGK